VVKKYLTVFLYLSETNFSPEILWFLSKNQYPDDATVKYAKYITKKMGLDVGRFQFQDRRDCPY